MWSSTTRNNGNLNTYLTAKGKPTSLDILSAGRIWQKVQHMGAKDNMEDCSELIPKFDYRLIDTVSIHQRLRRKKGEGMGSPHAGF